MSDSPSYWETLSNKITTPTETRNKRVDISDHEVSYLRRFVGAEHEILDIGSGSGLIVNPLSEHVRHITAVETFPGFSRFIADKPNILSINAALEGFLMRKQFDAVTCTGVMQFFKKNVAFGIYKNAYAMTRPGGLFLLRTHCGLRETVVVDKFSEELQSRYFAEYRHVDVEKEMLKEAGFSAVEVADEAHESYSAWENTRHFYFICKK